ncbi:trigger factor [Rhodamnia argentea]|uniref:peptidylprolyl isomerase n=1 Tax=Rhodamnia argentea TaxID=178133 RepID=A0A8B8NZU2_9MYRT|nr:trigger factor [Rhodamnia argentea]
MEVAITNNPPLLGSNHKIINVKQAVNVSIPSVSSKVARLSLQRRYFPQEFGGRRNNKGFGAIFSAAPGIENVEAAPHFEDVSVTNTTSSSDRELKIRVEVSGAKTQVIFNDVFDKLVAAAQPIPGFRREKGGKTPNIPRDILLEILGPSKVYKQVIKNVINSTVAEYVQKNGLKVGKDLTVEQSFEDLEDSFEPGETFSFSAVVQLLE